MNVSYLQKGYFVFLRVDETKDPHLYFDLRANKNIYIFFENLVHLKGYRNQYHVALARPCKQCGSTAFKNIFLSVQYFCDRQLASLCI